MDANNVKWVYGSGTGSNGKAIKGWVGLTDLDENVLSEAQIDGDTVRFEIGAHRIAQVKIYR